MALQECGLNLNRVSKELQPHGSFEFPCAGYASQHKKKTEDTIPWHWHEEMEIIWIAEGQLKLKTSSSSFLLSKGQIAVINSNILHYAAAAADISERECLRCFQKMLQISPIQYLLKYRVMQGAKMLLEDPAASISEAAVRCGFDSPSNFTKMFRRFYNCTPREYRHMQIDGAVCHR